jgi:hypothetical protein
MGMRSGNARYSAMIGSWVRGWGWGDVGDAVSGL